MFLKKKSTIFVLDNLRMNEEYDKLIQRLNENIRKLILLYNDEKETNGKLSNELEEKGNELNLYKTKYQEIDKKYENLKMAKLLEGNVEDKDAKLKLNKIIREIDNCIALLNK